MLAEWYALRSKPNKEELLMDQLLIRKMEVYYPRIRVKPVNPRSRHLRSYFPGYLFVKIDLCQVSISNLAWIPGANHLVSFDGLPATIPDSLITAVRKKVDAFHQDCGKNSCAWEPGNRVVIGYGPFAGYEAIFDGHISGKERVRVLLTYLQNRHLPVELRHSQIRRTKRS